MKERRESISQDGWSQTTLELPSNNTETRGLRSMSQEPFVKANTWLTCVGVQMETGE